ncbi:hypothetical protein [Acetobacter orleanensis]|uniref:Uncharacterized protein n=1 Tax=Acetobacter orleanensis TaxID=104099 RepID=A0A4Y3TNN1_9PROT|nr:hypothetical protein [Acetobacter orleanensis]GAN68558.1 hypothetical protein Abol_019_035 [Acetobacter orleanensis JCM 7639]GEB82637.1 hypothetical protein AOR01nite_11140 [Acetobacter orleanensis]
MSIEGDFNELLSTIKVELISSGNDVLSIKYLFPELPPFPVVTATDKVFPRHAAPDNALRAIALAA